MKIYSQVIQEYDFPFKKQQKKLHFTNHRLNIPNIVQISDFQSVWQPLTEHWPGKGKVSPHTVNATSNDRV